MNILSLPLTEVKGVGQKIAQKLAKLKIHTVKDLLYYFPFRYQDFSKISKISQLSEGEVATIYAKIEKISLYKTPRRKMWILEATISDDTGQMKAIWFNQKFLINTLKEGKTANFAGKVTTEGKKFIFQNPIFEIISDEFQETRHTARLVPIYPQTNGVTSKMLRFVLSKVIPLTKNIAEFLPKEVVEKFNFPTLSEAFLQIHFPQSVESAKNAQKRFAFQDLFLLQLINASERYSLSQQKSFSCNYTPEFVKKLFAYIPFELTFSQKKALYEILQDLQKNYPTSRLLQGDVGSGKTIVAAIAALVVAHNKKQSVFMAPTEVLARQHYETFKKYFEEFKEGVALLTSDQAVVFFGDNLESNIKKKDLISQIKNNKVKIIIGTHSVIQKNVSFGDVAFVVIDEQHRFGVKQRAQLVSGKEIVPHFLSMSATPIPRTLAMTIFGDLNLSIISELPKNRKPVITKAVSAANRQKAYDFIAQQIRAGRQAFVICPRIEPNDPFLVPTKRQLSNLEVRSVKEEYERLSKKIFPDFKIAMLHGQMKSDEKQKIMQDFKDRKYDILVSTSVIEVGIDVPNATIMMIEGSEHFGLSQLYQFRGRVGRGEHQSYCFLFSDINSKTTNQRIRALINAKNGFELAEIDLKLRGPGQFLGEEQTGLPDLAMKAIQNPQLVKTARDVAWSIISTDPSLKNHPYLAAYVKMFKNQIHLE
jgi:ATP-dependent DNA helicase RecG